MGGRRFRQAAPDDGVAVHHRLHRRQPRLAPVFRGPHARPASRRGDRRAVAPGALVRVPDPPDVSLDAERLVLQLEPRRTAADVRLHRPLRPRQSVPLPCEQRRARRGPVLRHPGHCPGRRRTQGTPPRRPAGGERRDLERHAPRESPDTLRTVRDRRERGGDDGAGAVEPPAGLPRGVRRGGAAGEPVGAPGPGRRAHADSSSGHPRRVTGCADDRVYRWRPVHRAAGAHAGEPHAARPARSSSSRAPWSSMSWRSSTSRSG